MLSRTAQMVARTARAVVAKKQGQPRGNLEDALTLAPIEDTAEIHEHRVRRYERACGLSRGSAVPIAYPETLFLAPMARLVTAARFPVSPLGLIHIAQTIERDRHVPRSGAVALRCAVGDVRATERGCEIDLQLGVSLVGGAAPIWRGVVTLLSRNARTRHGRGARKAGAEVPADAVIVEVPALTGLRYAAASGDFNPHHLFRFTARPLGYDRPIAHGMWTLARALGVLEERAPLPEATSVEARFQRPVLMPGRIAIACDRDGDATALRVVSPDTGAPHLTANVRAARPLSVSAVP